MLNVPLKNNGFTCLVLKYQYHFFRSQLQNICSILLISFKHTLEMQVTESPTAVAVQDYTHLDDPGLNHYIFITIILTKLYNCT